MEKRSKKIMDHLKRIHGDKEKAKKWLESQTSNFTFKKFSEMKNEEIENELNFAGHQLAQ